MDFTSEKTQRKLSLLAPYRTLIELNGSYSHISEYRIEVLYLDEWLNSTYYFVVHKGAEILVINLISILFPVHGYY